MARMKKRASNAEQDSPLSGPQRPRTPLPDSSRVNVSTGKVGPDSRQAARVKLLKMMAARRKK